MAVPCAAQTFVQLADLGHGIGARLTRNVTDSALDRALFGAIGTKVSYIAEARSTRSPPIQFGAV
jgi:hypothetical protein